MAEMVRQEDVLNDAIFDEATEMVEDPLNKWCCLYQVLLLQDDFVNVKPEIHHYLEGPGMYTYFILISQWDQSDQNAVKMDEVP